MSPNAMKPKTNSKSCGDIEFATYDCSYNIMLPYKISNGDEYKYVSIDKCLLPEIISLWEHGIKTTGCCCGHGKQHPFIGVAPEYIPTMKELGYKVQFNSCRPKDTDSFVPKTKLHYGEIRKGFNWWDKATEEGS